jgi:SAM-dependent methyltransferase
LSEILEPVAPTVANPLVLRPEEQGCCPACGGRALLPVLRLRSVPTNSCLMLDTPEEARAYPRGEIDLVFCEACCFVFNRACDPALTEYSARYEPTQGYSGTFRRFHEDLAARLIAGADLKGGTVVEVGCGQGEFLHLLCRLGRARGIGFDPCLSAERADVVGERAAAVSLRGEFFSDASAAGLRADLLVCKMTLEHIPAARRFAALTARVAGQSAPGMRLFIQVPECERIFRDGAFEDVYYEHCSYFTQASLAGLFARHGFAVDRIEREYAGQYLALQARYTGIAGAGPDAAERARLRAMLVRFAEATARKIAAWQALVTARREAGQRVVIWGSGSKGVAFLGALGGGEGISHVVDINPHRQGRFMVGTGHPIIAPDALPAIGPATVILMNPVYRDEVATELARHGLTPELLTL